MFTTNLSSQWKSKAVKFFAVIVVVAAFMPEAVAVVGINQKVFEKLQEAQLLTEEKNFAQAHEILRNLFDRKLNDHEMAQIKNLQANIYAMQNKYDKSIELFSEVIEVEDIPEGLRENAYRILMQLHMSQEQYEEALKLSDTLLVTASTVDSNLIALRGQCYYQLGDYENSEQSINDAIAMERKLNNLPKENWLLLLNAIHHAREDYSAMLPVLDQLIEYYPNDRYVYNLAAIYGQLGRQRDQLLLLEPLYESGYLTQKNQIMLLAQLFLAEGVPVKAARLLDRELKWRSDQPNKGSFDAEQRDIEVLAQAWTMANEPAKSVAPLTVIAKQSDNGDTYLRLAYAYNGMGDWAGVSTAVQKALNKGSLANKGNALVLLGMAQYRHKQYESAMQTFTEAQSFDSVAKMGQQWFKFVSSQHEKHELLKQTL